MSAGRGIALLLWPAAVAFGAVSILIARSDPGYWFAGQSATFAAVEIIGGGALLAVGLSSWLGRPGARLGVLLVATSVGWFLVEWNNPGIGSAVGFTIGLVLYATAPPLVAHAALAYPGGRLSSALERLVLIAAYAGAMLVVGLLPALFFDPDAAGCGECPRNLVLLHGSGDVVEALNRAGVYSGLAWSLTLVVVVLTRLVRSSPALRRLTWPALCAAAAYLGLVAASFAHSLGRGFLSNDPVDRRVWLLEAAALVVFSAAIAWNRVRASRTRADVARLVVELAESPAPGGLRDVLARTLGDPSLQVGYALEDGRLVDAEGRTFVPAGSVTPLVQRGQDVALLSHRPGLLDDRDLVEEVVAAARLALDNERLNAEARTQLEDLRASRARVIAAGDDERRRLERDLHDGAQQRLVGLSLSLRLAQSALGKEADADTSRRIDEADAELRTALAELRQLAHGIFPAVLADEGLAAALEALAEEASFPIRLRNLPDERVGADVEAAAYFVVAELVRLRVTGAVTIAVACDDGRLVLDVEGDGVPGELADLEDRVGALDGTLAIAPNPAGLSRIHAEIPCGS